MNEIVDKLQSTPTELNTSRIDENPAAVYLASLRSDKSRRVMHDGLMRIVSIVSGGPTDKQAVFTFPWHELRHQHTAFIAARLADEYSAASANRMLSALRGVIKSAWRLGFINAEARERACDIAPIRGETVPAGRDVQMGEIMTLAEVCKQDKNRAGGVRDAAIIGLLYTCGVRRAELVALDLADFDTQTGKIKVRGKGNKERTVYAANGTLDALCDWLMLRGSAPGALFVPVNKGGKLIRTRRLNPQTVYDMLKRRAQKAGLKDFSPHDFRRTFVGDMLDRGVDIATVQKMAGHASVTTTARYDRRGERAKQEAAAKLHFPYQRRDDLQMLPEVED